MSPNPDAAPGRAGVLFLCSWLPVGGAERLWAQMLPAMIDLGIPVKLVAINARGETFDQLEADGLDVAFLDAGDGVGALRCLPRLVREARAMRAGSIVSFGANVYALGALVGAITRLPHVVNWHQQVGFKWQGRSATACRAAARLGSGVICVSESNFPDLLELGFPRRRIRVVPNGVPAPSRPTDAAQPRSDHAVRVCLAARLSPEKRIDRFIEAMAIAAKRVPAITATVAGNGPLLAELEELRDRMGSPVELIGLHPEPTELMLESDIVCLSSDFETAPVALMEAAACGRPVVTTGVGAVPQMVDDGVTGLIANEASATALAELITELALDPAKRKTIGDNALRHWSAEFSFDAMLNGYVELLSAVTGPPVTWGS